MTETTNGVNSEALALWSDVLNGMPDFLAAWGLYKGEALSATLGDDVHYLFASWLQRRDLPADPPAYGRRLRPLLCHNREQQADFADYWLRYWTATSTQSATLISGQAAQQALAGEIERRVEQNPTASRLWRYTRKMRLGSRIMAALLMCGLLLWFYPVWQPYWQGYWQPSAVCPKTKVQDSTTGESTGGTASVTETPDMVNLVPVLKALPLRQPMWFRFPEEAARGRLWFLGAGGLLFLTPVAWLWYWRRIIFDTHSTRNPKANPLSLQARRSPLAGLLGQGAGHLLARLRFRKVATPQIDAAKTAQATARQAGFPCIVTAERYRQAEFLLVTSRRHRDDQSAVLFSRVQACLEQAQIGVRRFYFDRHPQKLYPAAPEPMQPLGLVAAARQFPHSRLLLAVDRELLFYRLSGEPQAWLQALQQRGDYLLALLSPPNGWQLERLRREGIPFRVAGELADIAPLLDFALPAVRSANGLDLEFPGDWLGNLAPEDSKEPLAWVVNTHSPAELRFLGWLAVYPALEGNLTQALFDEYAAAAGAQGQAQLAVLFNTTALPWCRQGWLPRWLRTALLAHMSKDDLQRTRRFFVRLLKKEHEPGRRIELPLHKPEGLAVWTWLLTLFRKARPNAPLRDAVFAQVMLLPGWLQTALPRRWLERLPELLIRQWPLRLALLAAFVLFMAGWAGIWQWLGQPQYGRYLLNQQRQTHAGVTVTLHYNQQTAAALEPLGLVLQGWGYRVAKHEVKDDVLQGLRTAFKAAGLALNAPGATNIVLAPPALVSEVADAVRFASWGGDFVLRTETAEQPHIYLAAMPRTGQVFRDESLEAAKIPVVYPEKAVWSEEKPLVVTGASAGGSATGDNASQPIFPQMIAIPAGSFMMGSPKTETGRYDDESPQHAVHIKAFEMAETELTFNEWERCSAAQVCREVNDRGWGRGKQPVINVSWRDAQDYIKWLNKFADKPYRLPSEAEWEYAARAGSQSAYWWGEAVGNKHAVCDGCGSQWDNKQTAPVKSFKPNPFGLFDTAGNVWEWTQDCWHDNYAKAPTDGSAWEVSNCTERSVRGGSWFGTPVLVRSALRNRLQPDEADNNSGFRLARTP